MNWKLKKTIQLIRAKKENISWSLIFAIFKHVRLEYVWMQLWWSHAIKKTWKIMKLINWTVVTFITNHIIYANWIDWLWVRNSFFFILTFVPRFQITRLFAMQSHRICTLLFKFFLIVLIPYWFCSCHAVTILLLSYKIQLMYSLHCFRFVLVFYLCHLLYCI